MVLGDKPVIGAIRGWAVGGGLEWVINCDFAIAAEGTRFFFPELSLGVFVTGGVTELLPRLVGLQRARELIMLGSASTRPGPGLGADPQGGGRCELMPRPLPGAAHRGLAPAAGRDLRRIFARRAGGGLDASMAAETEATVRGFLDPETAKRVAGFG
jgi:hypothetical protein